MSDDIVTRLRRQVWVDSEIGPALREAADEIERLREQCDTMRDLISRITADRTQYAIRVQSLKAEITRLERLATNGNP